MRHKPHRRRGGDSRCGTRIGSGPLTPEGYIVLALLNIRGAYETEPN